jgi:hypothetical protein
VELLADVGLQKSPDDPQSACCVHVLTHTLEGLLASMARHSVKAHSASAEQLSPSALRAPPSGPPVDDEDEDEDEEEEVPPDELLLEDDEDEDDDDDDEAPSVHKASTQVWSVRHSAGPRQVLRQVLATQRLGDGQLVPPQSSEVSGLLVQPRETRRMARGAARRMETMRSR